MKTIVKLYFFLSFALFCVPGSSSAQDMQPGQLIPIGSLQNQRYSEIYPRLSVITPDSRFLYVLAYRSDGSGIADILGYKIENDGKLTSLPDSPSTQNVLSDGYGTLLLGQGGRFLVSMGGNGSLLFVFRIESNGSLTRVSQFDLKVPIINEITTDQSGQYFYIPNYIDDDNSDKIFVVKLNLDGTLEQVSQHSIIENSSLVSIDSILNVNGLFFLTQENLVKDGELLNGDGSPAGGTAFEGQISPRVSKIEKDGSLGSFTPFLPPSYFLVPSEQIASPDNHSVFVIQRGSGSQDSQFVLAKYSINEKGEFTKQGVSVPITSYYYQSLIKMAASSDLFYAAFYNQSFTTLYSIKISSFDQSLASAANNAYNVQDMGSLDDFLILPNGKYLYALGSSSNLSSAQINFYRIYRPSSIKFRIYTGVNPFKANYYKISLGKSETPLQDLPAHSSSGVYSVEGDTVVLSNEAEDCSIIMDATGARTTCSLDSVNKGSDGVFELNFP